MQLVAALKNSESVIGQIDAFEMVCYFEDYFESNSLVF